MKKKLAYIITLLLLLESVFIPAYAASRVTDEYPNSDKWLTLSSNTSGARYFVDSLGNPVNLFGMARCQHHAQEEDVIFSSVRGIDALIEHYADYGMNFIRLALDIPDLCGGKARTADEISTYISNNIDPDVQAIIRNGMYVMLDIHMYPEGDGVDSAKATVQFAKDYYIPVLVELAKKYKDEPMVAVYELWNEPYAADQGGLEYDQNEWNESVRNYYIEAVEEIRKIDKRHVLLVSDWNAGWGTATGVTWSGYYDKIDPVYRNTCFSIHAGITELDTSYSYYKDYWADLANSANICLLFGEIETEGGISSEQGIQNFIDMLSKNESKCHFSACLWRPHGNEYKAIWGDSGWTAGYATPAPAPTSRYSIEAENIAVDSDLISLTKSNTFFGRTSSGTGVSLKPGISATDYYETSSINNVVWDSGNYTLTVRAAGTAKAKADFIVGYRTVSGKIYQIARFSGKNTNLQEYYQTVNFTSKEKIVSIVLFGCDKKTASAFIDRFYLIGKASANETVLRSRVDIKEVSQIIDLNGKSPKLENKKPNYSGTSSLQSSTVQTNDDFKNYEDNQIITVPGVAELTTTYNNRTVNKNTSNLLIIIYVMAGIVILATGFIIANTIVAKKRKKVNINRFTE